MALPEILATLVGPASAAAPKPVHAMGLVDLDPTAFINLGLFVALIFILNALLFQPYIRVTRERQRLSGGVASDAQEARAKAASLEAEFDRGLAAARAEAAQLRAELVGAAQSREAERLEAARQKAAVQLAERRERIELDASAADAQIQARSRELASLISQRLLQ
jgi:F-type H+-transporting ATPase subunit b